MDEIEYEIIMNLYYGDAYKTINPKFIINKVEGGLQLIRLNKKLSIVNTGLFNFIEESEDIYKIVISDYRDYPQYKEIRKYNFSSEEEVAIMSYLFDNPRMNKLSIPDEIKNKIRIKLDQEKYREQRRRSTKNV